MHISRQEQAAWRPTDIGPRVAALWFVNADWNYEFFAAEPLIIGDFQAEDGSCR
jgi:hypothetical protein